MRNRWIKFEWSIAIVLSVLLHGWLVGWMVRDEIRSLASILARGVHSDWVLLTHFDDETEPTKPAKDELGDTDGKGTAIAASDGDRPASGIESDMDQPFLSRDPVGMGKVGDAPSKYTGPTGGGDLSAAMQPTADADVAAARLRPAAPLVPPAMKNPLLAKSNDSPTPLIAPLPQAVVKSDEVTKPHENVSPPSVVVKADESKLPLIQNRPAVADAKSPERATPPVADVKTNDPNLPSTRDKPTVALARAGVASSGAPGPDESSTYSKQFALATPAPPAVPAKSDKPSFQLAVPPAADSAVAANATPAPPAAVKVAMNAPASPSRSPGLPLPSADRAPQSDSEIDPFMNGPSVEFRAGKTVVRVGRKSKLTRPHLPLVGFWDGVAIGRTAVTLHLVIDPTGKVVRADVVHSSGSNEIDNPICLEAYNWWFDPDKNADGEPIKTEMPLTIGLFR